MLLSVNTSSFDSIIFSTLKLCFEVIIVTSDVTQQGLILMLAYIQ